MRKAKGYLPHYVTYKGSVTKVRAEHIRRASSLERLLVTDWEEAKKEIAQASGIPSEQRPVEEPEEAEAAVPDEVEPVRTDAPTASRLALHLLLAIA